MLEIERTTDLSVNLNEEALSFYAKLMGEWARSRGEEKETDSPTLKNFKRFHLEFTDTNGLDVQLVSINEFEKVKGEMRKGEVTDELLDPFLDTAIEAHNRVMFPSQQIDRSTYLQEGWNRAEVIHDALFYAALPMFAYRMAQEKAH